MKRRQFIALIGGAAAAWPVAARGQQSMPVIGFLSARSPNNSASAVAEFHKGLGEEGYVEGRNVTTEYRWAEGQYDRLSQLAADLVRRQVAAIAAFSPPAAHAAKMATSIIPVIFTTGDDPIREGLVSSLSRPDRNVTGVTFFSGLLGAKRLELLKMLVAKADVMALLLNPNNQNSEEQAKDVQEAARVLKIRLHVFDARRQDEIKSAFTIIVRNKIYALIVGGDPMFTAQRVRLAALAAHHRVPAIYVQRDFAEAGGLMSYGASLIDAYRQVGVYAGRILKGEKPSDLPVVQPTKFELVINLKTAKELGLEIPPTLLALADEVLE